MLKKINRIFVLFIMFAALSGILLSVIVLFVPDLIGGDISATDYRTKDPNLLLSGPSADVYAYDSPHLVNYSISTPSLDEFDTLFIEVYTQGKLVSEIDCLEQDVDSSDYVGKSSISCEAYIPYNYQESQDYSIYAVLYSEEEEYVSQEQTIFIDWTNYEENFWSVSGFLIILVGGTYILLIFPLIAVIAFIASKMKHDGARPGEYTLSSMLNPFQNGKTLLQKFNSFLVSPYFWIFELAGILIILTYMLISAEVWKSSTAFVAFFLSGLMAFIVPFLWVAAWWYADFKEREPLRIIVTFFLWGMFSALMAIGINTVFGLVFSILGLGFLSAVLVAPPVEEFYKGSGLALLGEHHEFNSIEDGLVFGFVIGMGFSFIEDWIYMLNNPMGGDIIGWFVLFILRSFVFSSIHGLFTAIIGGSIGFLKERAFAAPALGLIPGAFIAAIFHAIHNSGGLLSVLLGAGGILTYLCILIPLFDYGGTFLVIMLFLWALLRKR
jgi:RsiW-degrading membrane proteinase PrsW (M82 family)